MLKLSRKNLFDTGARVFRVGYCGAQNLLRGCYALGVNRGLYGWNWEAYLLAPDVIINTGYRNMAGEDANKITSAYEKRAERIANDYKTDYTVRMNKIARIRAEWLDALRDM